MTLVVASGNLDSMELKTRLERLLWLVEHRAGGNQRELARKAELASSHIGTMLTRLRRNPDADIEGGTVTKIALATGVHEAWIISGREPRDISIPRAPTMISDRIHPVIARVGKTNGFTDAEIEGASGMLFGLAGTSDMTEEQALDHLETVRGARRRQERAFKVSTATVRDSGGSALDDLSGGKGSLLPRTKRTRR